MFDLLNFKFAHLQRNKQSIFYDSFILLDRNRISTKTLKKNSHYQRALKGCQGQDYRQAQGWNSGIWLQDHQKKSVMKRTQLLVQLFENGNGIKIAII